MKKITLLIVVLLVLGLNNTFAKIEIGTGGIIESEKVFNELECIKYTENARSGIVEKKDFFDLINYNFIQEEQKNKKESEKYKKFNQCQIDYKYNIEKQKYENFSVYNKYKKTKSLVYDKIFEDTVMFEDSTNECSFSAKKGDKAIFVLYGKEIGKYKVIHSMAVTNTDNGKAKIAFSAEKEDGKIVIVENGKEKYYSIKGEFKEGSLRYTNLGQLVFIEKEPFFGKELVFINGKQKEEFIGYEVSFLDNREVDVIYSVQDKNFLLTNHFINGEKIKHKFFHISDISYLSNGKIVYLGHSLNGDNLNYIVIDGKIGKGYKEFRRLYDIGTIYEKNTPFLETKNGDIYSIVKNNEKENIILKNGIEIYKYKNDVEVNLNNTNHFIYTVKLENGKYSIVVDGKKSLIEFDEKPKIGNQRFLKISQNGFLTLDFKYNNFNYICKSNEYQKSEKFKYFKLKQEIDIKFSKFLNKKFDKLTGKYTTGEILNIQKKALTSAKIKLSKIKKSKYKKLIPILKELIDSYLENIKKQYDRAKLYKSFDKKFTLSKRQIESGLFDKKTLKLKNNYNYKQIFTDKYLFSYIHQVFNYTSDENINYFKKEIFKYITKKGYNLSKDFKIGRGNKGGKYSGEPIFIIQSKYISDFPKNKRLEISFGE